MRLQVELLVVFGACLLLVPVQAQAESRFIRARATPATPATPIPDCSLDCLVTIVPEYCGSLTNTTCTCTSAELNAALTPCVLAACNVTDALQLERYSAQDCGVPDDRTRLDEEWHGVYCVPALATVFVAGRLYARSRFETGLGADDWMIVAALASYLTDICLGLQLLFSGFGRHTYWLTEDQIITALKYFYIAELFYLLTITLIKLSLLLFFRRIFPNRIFRMAIWIVFGFVIASNFSFAMAAMLQCLPFVSNWTDWLYKDPPGKCVSTFAIAFVAAIMSLFHDFVILFMPIPALWRLNLPWRKKANLLVMFSVGIFVTACSLIRLPCLLKLNLSSDPSYDQAPVVFWSGLENGVGIICGCLPACRSLVAHLFPRLNMITRPSEGASSETYGSHSRPRIKPDAKQVDSSTRTFVELESYPENSEGMETGPTDSEELETGPTDRASAHSQDSETPIHV